MHESQIRIKSPCQEDWDAMDGDSRRRHCAACDREVVNLSAHSRAEAEAIVAGRPAGQRLCVRYGVDAAGAVQFRRAPLIPAAMLLRARRLALGAGLATAALAGCTPAGPVSGAVAARALSGAAAERLGEEGVCSLSLEPVLPVTLRLHARACASGGEAQPRPARMVLGEMAAAPPPAPAPPEPPAPPAPAVSAPTPKPHRAPRRAEKPKKEPEIRFLQGDIAG